MAATTSVKSSKTNKVDKAAQAAIRVQIRRPGKPNHINEPWDGSNGKPENKPENKK